MSITADTWGRTSIIIETIKPITSVLLRRFSEAHNPQHVAINDIESLPIPDDQKLTDGSITIKKAKYFINLELFFVAKLKLESKARSPIVPNILNIKDIPMNDRFKQFIIADIRYLTKLLPKLKGIRSIFANS